MNRPHMLTVPKGTLYRTDEEKIGLESRNGVVQAMFVLDKVQSWGRDDRITPELLLEFQRIAVNNIYRCAGHFRNGPVFVKDARGHTVHQPPSADDVRPLVEEMCAYVNGNWHAKKPIHLAAYAMWRLNWIHPFFGGNGRTARAFSYLVLCAALRLSLPADAKTIPQLIEEDRVPYMKALRAADRAWEEGRLDVGHMENVLSDLLAMQLVFLYQEATGENHF